jgi:hypothetical protein
MVDLRGDGDLSLVRSLFEGSGEAGMGSVKVEGR